MRILAVMLVGTISIFGCQGESGHGGQASEAPNPLPGPPPGPPPDALPICQAQGSDALFNLNEFNEITIDDSPADWADVQAWSSTSGKAAVFTWKGGSPIPATVSSAGLAGANKKKSYFVSQSSPVHSTWY